MVGWIGHGWTILVPVTVGWILSFDPVPSFNTGRGSIPTALALQFNAVFFGGAVNSDACLSWFLVNGSSLVVVESFLVG